MKIPVIATGISGLVGSRVAELLGDKYLFINFSLDNNIDITNANLLNKIYCQYSHIKTILHLAAFTNVNAAFNQKENKNSSCYQVNVIGSKNIAQLCLKNNIYLINISTDFVFDGQKLVGEKYTEKDLPNPIEWYGKTKYLAEQELKNSGCQYCTLRIAFPFKAKKASQKLEPEPKLDLVRKFKVKLQHHEELHLFNDQIITPTFIDDIAKVVNYCLKNQPQGIYHCVGSSNLSPYDLALKIANTFNFDKSLISRFSLKDFLRQNPNSRPRQVNLSLSNKKLEREFGIKMTTIDEALGKCKKQLNIGK